jgi:hypothetical protein
MALSPQDTATLEDIVRTEGNCLDSKRCTVCPFRAACLPEFLNPVPPSQPQRLRMALGVLTHHLLVDDEASPAEVQEEYTWEKT